MLALHSKVKMALVCPTYTVNWCRLVITYKCKKEKKKKKKKEFLSLGKLKWCKPHAQWIFFPIDGAPTGISSPVFIWS